MFLFLFFFLIVRLLAKTTWNLVIFKPVEVNLKSLCHWPLVALNFPHCQCGWLIWQYKAVYFFQFATKRKSDCKHYVNIKKIIELKAATFRSLTCILFHAGCNFHHHYFLRVLVESYLDRRDGVWSLFYVFSGSFLTFLPRNYWFFFPALYSRKRK